MSGIVNDGGAPQSSSMAALELLADPVRLAARIKELKDAEEGAGRAIALVAPAAEIPVLRARAIEDADRAALELKQAIEVREQADNAARAVVELADASAKAQIDSSAKEALEILSKSRDEAKEIVDTAAAIREDARALAASNIALKESMEAAQGAAEKALGEAQAAQAAAEAAEKKYVALHARVMAAFPEPDAP